jgi:hypothetical protein
MNSSVPSNGNQLIQLLQLLQSNPQLLSSFAHQPQQGTFSFPLSNEGPKTSDSDLDSMSDHRHQSVLSSPQKHKTKLVEQSKLQQSRHDEGLTIDPSPLHQLLQQEQSRGKKGNEQDGSGFHSDDLKEMIESSYKKDYSNWKSFFAYYRLPKETVKVLHSISFYLKDTRQLLLFISMKWLKLGKKMRNDYLKTDLCSSSSSGQGISAGK